MDLLIVLAITVMASVLVGVGQVYITGMEGVRLKADQTLWLFFETAALFGISFFIIRLAQTKWLRFFAVVYDMGFYGSTRYFSRCWYPGPTWRL